MPSPARLRFLRLDAQSINIRAQNLADRNKCSAGTALPFLFFVVALILQLVAASSLTKPGVTHAIYLFKLDFGGLPKEFQMKTLDGTRLGSPDSGSTVGVWGFCDYDKRSNNVTEHAGPHNCVRHFGEHRDWYFRNIPGLAKHDAILHAIAPIMTIITIVVVSVVKGLRSRLTTPAESHRIYTVRVWKWLGLYFSLLLFAGVLFYNFIHDLVFVDRVREDNAKDDIRVATGDFTWGSVVWLNMVAVIFQLAAIILLAARDFVHRVQVIGRPVAVDEATDEPKVTGSAEHITHAGDSRA